MAKESIVIHDSSSRPTTLLLRDNRRHFYNTWILNNRLQIENEKLYKRQQSSCTCAFYSLCIFVIAGIIIIVIHRFTDKCSLIIDSKQIFSICSRYWLFFAAALMGCLSCFSFIFGACRYFCSGRINFTYENNILTTLGNTNEGFPRMKITHYPGIPVLLENGSSINSFEYHDDEHSNKTIHSWSTNTTLQHQIPPFNYDKLPNESIIPIRISISPVINTDQQTKDCPSSRTSLATINSNKSKLSLISGDIHLRTPTSYSSLNI